MSTLSDLQWSPAVVSDVGGTRLAIRRVGTGQPVLLLHGLHETSEAWTGVAAELLGDRLVIAPDLPGFAGSAGDEAAGVTALDVLDLLVRETCEQEQQESCDIVGYAWGATLAIALAARLGPAVRRLGLVSGGWPPGLPSGPAGDVPGLTRWQQLAELAGPAAGAWLRRSYLKAPAPVGSPRPQRSLVVWGAHDRRLRPRYGEKVVSALGRYVDPACVEMVTLPGVGPAPHRDAPDVVGALLCAFLQAP